MNRESPGFSHGECQLVEYPRDFANEYNVFAGTRQEIDQLHAVLDARRREGSTLQRITRREAIRLGWSRPRDARRDHEQWFGGFADHAGWRVERNPETVAEAITLARMSAQDEIDSYEAAQSY